uniref:ATP synthase complex subunit 8 n=1 Tax=Phryganogryllacris xiai TaxID=1945534 RepID=A0A1Q1MPV0_9ORTH|nr:ATP synthase F0 subunit 8 [Phryganogryllacris xiai]AQM40099.1 ATP synthase F0 subunit 8 [Phryganogryllacris xiai]
MAPISWLILFFIFSMTLILFSMINYYLTQPLLPLPLMSKTKTSFPHLTLNWKW